MNKYYENYLKSEHWREFRKTILKKRKRCQSCGIKEKLNIHHKHYRNIGKEKNEDVIVLCQDCHLRYHKKPKWIKAKRLRRDMNFTGEKRGVPFIPKVSVGLEECSRCSELHLTYVKKYKHGKFEVMLCHNSKPRVLALRRYYE